ncbi:MAG: hypothetical protein GY830_10845 [Bacteroidetes bacterium]|nr:hypothetical protein [Bacteroidota bacterium]
MEALTKFETVKVIAEKINKINDKISKEDLTSIFFLYELETTNENKELLNSLINYALRQNMTIEEIKNSMLGKGRSFTWDGNKVIGVKN